MAGHERVLSTGTFLDSLRFRVHLGRKFGISASSVEAAVLGEHGTSQVYLWSSARVGGVSVSDLVKRRGESMEALCKEIEDEVRNANLTIIEDNGASQYGIGIVSARITEAILRNEKAVFPVGFYNPKYGVTLSLPSIVGASGVVRVLEPDFTGEERRALQHSAEAIRAALEQQVEAA
jgi:L-lactate dehydrogenase